MNAEQEHQPSEGTLQPGLAHRRWPRYAVGFVLIALLALSSTHLRVALSSAVFLNEIFPDAPAYPGRWVTEEPTRTFVQFRHEDTYKPALLYRPGRAECGGGIVLYIGLGPEYGDAHLDRLGRAFSRNGYSVLIPMSEPMIDYRLSAEEHDIAVSAFTSLQQQSNVNPERVGMFGISVGGAVVVNAAQQPEIQDSVRMVHSLGGFFDASQVLAQMSLRAYQVDGEWHEWEPSATTFRATRNSLVPLLPSEDRSALWELFGKDETEIPSDLTPEGHALASVLTNRDPSRVDKLLGELPPVQKEFLDAISPAGDIDQLTTSVLLLHDRNDHVLPYSESVSLANRAEEVDADVRLTLLDHFHHVRPDQDVGIWSQARDATRLYRHIFAMHWTMDDRGVFTSPLDLLPFVDRPDSC